MAFQTFNANSVSTSTPSSFDHGVEYPALVTGLWNASTEYQGKVRHGMAILVLLKDNNDKYIYRSMFMSLDGYVLGQNAAYSKIMRGLLRCSDTDGALKEKINAAGLNDISTLVGRPCLARICVKEKDGKAWSSIDTLSGETPRFHGLEMPKIEDIEPVDIERVCGKFIKVASVDDCVTIPTLRVLGRSQNPRTNNSEFEPIFRDLGNDDGLV